jgi:DNA-binding winged helix-turn-helix (wHTH) protein/Flp pilus assembly protein TadD
MHEDRVFEFSNFILVPKERLLICGGEPVPLTPKAFDVLVVLVHRSGHLVSKGDLLREVWPDSLVEEVNLTVNISALRKVLDRDRKGASMIQTVPTHGYRFVGPVMARNAAVCRAFDDGSADAYRAYLLGRFDWSQRSEAGLTRAIEHFQRAVQIDPTFAPAYSGMADCYATLGYLSSLAPSEAFSLARRYAAKALELDKSLAEAHASLGFVKLYFDWDWADAEADFQRAIALDPNYAPSREWYSIFLLAAGRPEDGFREIQLARQPDPLSLPVNTDLGFHYYYTGRYGEAVKQLNFVLELNKEFPPAHLWLGRTYQELGRLNDALAEFQRVDGKLPEWPVSIAARGYVAGLAGRTDEAQNTLTELRRLAGKKFVTSYGVALVYAGLGQKDSAFAWLDKAFDERSHWLIWLRLDPRWKELRSDPRFAELVRRVGYPDQTNRID